MRPLVRDVLFIVHILRKAAMSTIVYCACGPRHPKWGFVQHVARDICVAGLSYPLASVPDEEDIHELDPEAVARELRIRRVPPTSVPKQLCTMKESSLAVSEVPIDASIFAQLDDIPRERIAKLVEEDKTAAGSKRRLFYDVVCPKGLYAPKAQLYSAEPLVTDECICIYFHGGAYMMESKNGYRNAVGHLSAGVGLRIYSLEYRLAPVHPFPAQLHDAFILFLHLINRGFKPQNIILMGDSAGGNLCLILHQLLRQLKYPNVRALILNSPWVDLYSQRPSTKRNEHMDALHYHSVSEPCAYARLYYEPGRRFSESLLSELTHPLLSPINADFTDMPPTLIQYGDLELIVDDITEMYERIVKQNPGREKDIVCECYKGMFHDFQLIVDTKDALEAFNGIKEFVKGL